MAGKAHPPFLYSPLHRSGLYFYIALHLPCTTPILTLGLCNGQVVERLHCTLNNAHCTLHTAHCTLHTTHCILPTLQCTMHTENGTLHAAHCILLVSAITGVKEALDKGSPSSPQYCTALHCTAHRLKLYSHYNQLDLGYPYW